MIGGPRKTRNIDTEYIKESPYLQYYVHLSLTFLLYAVLSIPIHYYRCHLEQCDDECTIVCRIGSLRHYLFLGHQFGDDLRPPNNDDKRVDCSQHQASVRSIQ
jgi:hypothetical protein